jgi:hypothetical protein
MKMGVKFGHVPVDLKKSTLFSTLVWWHRHGRIILILRSINMFRHELDTMTLGTENIGKWWGADERGWKDTCGRSERY